MSRKHGKIEIALLVVFMGGLMTTGAVWSSSRKRPSGHKSSQVAKWAVSKTDALQLVNTKVTNGLVQVSLRNVSNKNMNGIQLSVNGSISQIEFLDADEPNQNLLPGAIYQEWFPFPDDSKPAQIAVLAVTFDDKTIDGDKSLAREIIDTRRGRRKQLMRFADLLADALNSADADSFASIDKLKIELNNLPDEATTDSGAMKMGQRQAKEEIGRELDYVRRRQLSQSGTIRTLLSELKNKHERRIKDLE